MEKRIKTLYIITIFAILSFLGMQGYWVYGRYEFALMEHERSLMDRITECVNEYREIRNHQTYDKQDSLHTPHEEDIVIPRFSLMQQYGDTVKTTRTATVMTYHKSAYDLLGIEPGTPLTDEMKNRALELAQLETPSDSVAYDASGANDENEAWMAAQNIHIERRGPFTSEGIDSVLTKAGIKVRIEISRADSMVWNTEVSYHRSVVNPEISMTVPYSQLEGQTVTLSCKINPFDILPGMWQTLLISLVVSVFLIVCLILQFSTVLKLSRLDKMRTGFITTMIHELKRPIGTLKMCVSGLDNRRMMEDESTKRDLISETRNALDNLSAYFSKLRDITFNNVEQIPLNIQIISLRKLFDAVAAGVSVPADKNVSIINDIESDIEVSADRSHLFNILNNLVENAVKYSGTSVEIRAEAAVVNGSVSMHISDNGNGIPSGDLRHIFKRFYRGKASAGEQPGMGLGLAYVRLLTEAHGGEIGVESTEGEGTCFTIRLPQ